MSFRRRTPIAVVIAIPVACCAAAYLFVTRPKEPDQVVVTRTGRAPLPPDSYPLDSLPAGTVAPDFEAAGWLSGNPVRRGAPDTRFVLVDIWSGW